MEFTSDWFSENIPVWSKLLSQFTGKPGVRGLEIGVYEGRATCWLLENILTGDNVHLDCIDNFEGGPEYDPAEFDFRTVQERFENNVLPWQDRVHLHVGKSADILPALKPGFDIVYIDGCHQSREVLSDAVMSWHLMNPGGVMIFDDYEWNEFPDQPWLNPKLAIHAFMQSFTGWNEILHVGYQFALRKLGSYTPPPAASPPAPRPSE